MTVVKSITSANNVTEFPIGEPGLVITAEILVAEGGAAAPVDTVVSWVVTGGTPASSTSNTDAQGKATLTVKASAAGAVTVTATTTEDTTGKALSLTATAPSADIHDIDLQTNIGTLPNDAGYAAAGYCATVTANVTLKADGKPVPNLPVTWTADVPKVVLTPLSDATDATGNIKVEVSIPTELTPFTETIKITASSGGSSAVMSLKVAPVDVLVPAPLVTNASINDNFSLDSYDIAAGVSVVVANPLKNVAYSVWWGKAGKMEYVVSDNTKPLIIDMTPYADTCFKDGTYPVFYVITEGSGNLTYSKSNAITVKNSDFTTPTLSAPSIPVSDNDNMININDTATDVRVIVKYSGITDGDIITLYWRVTDNKGHLIKGTNVSQDYVVTNGAVSHSFSIPSTIFYPNGTGIEGEGKAYYTVKRQGDVLLSFDKKPRVDTTPPTA